MRRAERGIAAASRCVVAGIAVSVLTSACGSPGPGAREGAAASVLAPAAFGLVLRGIEVTLDEHGAVHAGDCDARLDFAAAELTARDGRVLSRLVGDGWPRTLVIGDGAPPVTVTERDVVAGDRTLFSLAEGGRLLDAGGGAPGPTEIATSGLEPDEQTTALALLALVSACWEAPPSSATE